MAFKTSASATARLLRAVCILSILSSLMLFATVEAQQSAPAVTRAPAATINPGMPPVVATHSAASLAGKPDIRPLWNELTPGQQQILAPLAPEWNKLDGNHKSKWLAIGAKYGTMTPEQQSRLLKNIRDWANMTPEQHRLARESYARAKKLDAEQKTAQWQQYQQLPEEQKEKLAADAKEKKRIANVPSLQNKRKTVEPLNASKKPLINHNGTPPGANQIGLPSTVPAATGTPAAAATAAPSAPAAAKPTQP